MLSGVTWRPSCLRLQVQRVGFRIGLRDRGHFAQQRHLQLRRHVGRDLVLDGEDVVQRSVPRVRPQVIPVLGPDQLGGDAHLVVGLPDRALQHVRHLQALGDLGDLQVLVLERERRCAGRHLQPGDLRQQVQQLLGDAVGEELLLRVGAHVDEREHRDRGGHGAGRRGGFRRPIHSGRRSRLPAHVPHAREQCGHADERKHTRRPARRGGGRR